MLIIGHRGAAGLERENTISSFVKAQELGVDAVELDVRQARNGTIVVVHDRDPKRIYEAAPVLADVLSSIKIPVNLEVKETGFEKKLLETIKDFPFEFVISSFNPLVLRKFRSLDRNIKLGLIISPKFKHLYYLLALYAFYLGLNSVNPHHSLLTENRMRFLRRLGFKVFTWVINNPDEFAKAKKFEVDGVVTDRPDIIHK